MWLLVSKLKFICGKHGYALNMWSFPCGKFSFMPLIYYSFQNFHYVSIINLGKHGAIDSPSLRSVSETVVFAMQVVLAYQ